MKSCNCACKWRCKCAEPKLNAQAEELQRQLFDNPDNKVDEACKLLEHARGLYIYWAGQRLNTIRFFLISFAAILLGDTGIFINDDGESDTQFFGIVGIVTSLFFWGLDKRNSELVVNAERAMDVVERVLATKYKFDYFQITYRSDRPKWQFLQYKYIMNVVFAICLVTSILMIIL